VKNRNCVLFTPLFFLLAAGVFAQGADGGAKKAALGIGAEWNMNSRENFAGGAALSFDYNLPHSLALGITVTASSNFYAITVIEPSALFRWYFLNSGHSGLFVQADLGCFMLLEESDFTLLFDGGLRCGFRFPLGTAFYLEPYGRIGYPFAFGVGALFGIRF
jgi:hypothetical protein